MPRFIIKLAHQQDQVLILSSSEIMIGREKIVNSYFTQIYL